MISKELLLKHGRIKRIPNGWKLCPVGSVCSIRNNLRKPISTDERKHMRGVFPYYGPTGILDYVNEYLVEGTFALIGEDGDHFLQPDKKDQTLLVSGKFNVNNHAHIIESTERCLAEWFSIYFRYRNIVGFLTRQGASRYKLNKSTLERIPILLPPLPEQEAIAGVLECWDKGIQSLEKKIEKKRNIKKGLMQQLLSGKRRLPGFGAELGIKNGECGIPKGWKTVKLGDAFSFVKSHAFSRDCLTTPDKKNSGVYNIHYGDIHATYDGCVVDMGKEDRVPLLKTSAELPKIIAPLQDGDLVMADASEDYEGVGACIELIGIGDRKVTGGLHTFILRDSSEETSVGYRGYMFSEYALAKELKRIATGVSVYSISKTNLVKVVLTLPPMEEQKAIAVVLSAADREIEALERKLSTWKDQKKYLLNNLVTGTIRLPQFTN